MDNFFSLIFFSLDKISKIKICHMVAKEHPEVIEGRRQLIAVDVLDSDEADEDAAIDQDYSALNEEYGSGLVGAGVTENVGDMYKALKSSYILSYMLKPSHLLTQGFGNNMIEQDKLFKHVCNFGSREELRNGRRVVSYYLAVDTTKYQCRLLNPRPLDCISGYIM